MRAPTARLATGILAACWGFALPTPSADAQDMAGIVVERPIARGDCGVGMRGNDRYMICRDANGALRNEGVIRGGSAPAATAAQPPSRNMTAPGDAARPATVRNQRLAAIPINRATFRYGQITIEGCEAIYGLMDGFDGPGFNVRRPGTAIYEGSDFRVANFLSDEATKRHFNLELSSWSAGQKADFLEALRSCALEADRLAYNPEAEPQLRPHAATIRAYAAAMRDLLNYLPDAFDTLSNRAALLEQLRTQIVLYRAETVDSDTLLRLAVLRNSGELANLGGKFSALQRLDAGGRDDIYKAFAEARDFKIDQTVADIRQAVSAAASAPVTIESFSALSRKIAANPFFVGASNRIPDHPKIAPIVTQLRGITDQIRGGVMRDFDAKVAATPLTVAGADAILQAADEVAATGLQLTPESRAKGEERFRAAYRAGILAAERAVQAVDIRSYRDFEKIDAALDAHFPPTDINASGASFTLGPVLADFDRLGATTAALKRAAADRYFEAFARDLADIPNTQEGKERIEKDFSPLLAHIDGPSGETYRRAVEVKLAAVNAGAKARKCTDELAKNGVSPGDGERPIAGPRGTSTFAEFACQAMASDVRVYDLKIPNLVTGLFSSKITFRIAPPGDLPFTVEAEERELDGRKAIIGLRAIQDVSQYAVALRIEDWRAMIQNPGTAHRIFDRR